VRTTLNLDDDVMEAAKALARFERRTLGQVVSDLARRGLAPRPAEHPAAVGFPMFSVTEDAPAITDEMVAAALDDS
jgi:hypothetical protein